MTSIKGVGANRYRYDANGNRTASRDGKVVYNSLNKPVSIEAGEAGHRFLYDPDHNRFQQQIYHSGQLLQTKWYVDGVYEKSVDGLGRAQHVHYISAGGDAPFAIYIETEAAKTAIPSVEESTPLTLQYLHRDHLGSVQTVTDEAGQLVDELSFGPWGRRRSPGWKERASDGGSLRGFTGHEQLDGVGLVHMNGRLYDPTVARFLNPDPFVQEALSTQNLNRYSYVLNNPMQSHRGCGPRVGNDPGCV